MKLSFFILSIATVFRECRGFTGDFPSCELCGCSFCAAGEFPVGNQAGMIDLYALRDELGDIPLDRYGQTFGDFINSLGFESVPCSLIDLAAVGGAFPPEACADVLRLNPTFRNSCGCPPLPPSPPIALDSLTLAPAVFTPTAAAPFAPAFAPTPALNPIFAPTPALTPSARGVDVESSSWNRIMMSWLVTFFVLLVSLATVLLCCVMAAKQRRNTTPSNTSSRQAPEFDQQTIETQRTYLTAIENSNLEQAIENSKRDVGIPHASEEG